MNLDIQNSATEAVLLTTFLGDEEIKRLAKNSRFRAHLVSQKRIIAELLKNSFELAGEDAGEEIPLPRIKKTEPVSATVVYKPSSKPAVTQAPATALQATPQPAQAPEPVLPTAKNTAALLKEVTNLFAEKTGYPEDMLGPDLDLEADLGIDTVKQMEILGLIRKKYSLSLKENFSLKQTPSLSAIAKMIEGA